MQNSSEFQFTIPRRTEMEHCRRHGLLLKD